MTLPALTEGSHAPATEARPETTPFLLFRSLRASACGRLVSLLPQLRRQRHPYDACGMSLPQTIAAIPETAWESIPAPERRFYSLIFGICYMTTEAVNILFRPGPEKMIRDGIGRRIFGTKPSLVRQADSEEAWPFLVKKLGEELSELKLSDFNDAEEYADVIAVLTEMAHRRGISPNALLSAIDYKMAKNGAFSENWILRMK